MLQFFIISSLYTFLSFEDIDLTVKLKYIDEFERMDNLTINVFGTEICFKNGILMSETISPLLFTEVKGNSHVSLLLNTEN